MKTKTILNAYLRSKDIERWISERTNLRCARQEFKFRDELHRRIEAGDRARTALQMANRAYYSGDDELLATILRSAQ